ncbi:MAG: c-type cytochrome domain-containing protein, partial [Pirellulaceae bacterium]
MSHPIAKDVAMLPARLSVAMSILNFYRFAQRLVVPIGFLMALSSLVVQQAWGDDESSQLEQKALAIFQSRCIECHQEKVQEGGLRLDRREGLIQGGDSGLAIQLGNSTQSLLVTRITATDDSRMPPNGSPLDPAQIDALSKFIDQGAPWGNQTLGDPRLQHWAWQPIQSTQLPEATEMHKEEGNPIDRFLDASLAEKG